MFPDLIVLELSLLDASNVLYLDSIQPCSCPIILFVAIGCYHELHM